MRNAPLAQRRQTAMIFTVVIVAIIAVIWAASLWFRLGADSSSTQTLKEITPKEAGIQSPY